jgi:hypothetical protein
MDFDLSKLSTEAKTDDNPVELAIKNRDGVPYTANGKPVILLVVGEYSQAYRESERRLTNKVLKAARHGDEVAAEEVEQRTLERVAGGVVGWRNVMVDGKEAQFSADGVMKLLRAAPWVAKQVEGAIARHASFFSSASAG